MRTAKFFTRIGGAGFLLAASLTVASISDGAISPKGVVQLQISGAIGKIHALGVSGTSSDAGPSATEPPVIAGSAGAQSADVPQGQTVIIRVVVDGTPPFSFQWLFNGLPITGATDSDLLLSNLQRSDAGAYSVVVSNSAGSATSAVTYLHVIPADGSGTGPSGPQPGVIQFATAVVDAIEDFGSISIEVERVGDLSLPATVWWSIQGGSATAGVDYSIDTPNELSFDPGEFEKSIVVQLVDDNITEPTRSLIFVLHDPANAILGQVTTTTLNIYDNDDESFVPPRLDASFTGEQLVLTWPSSSIPFAVETTSTLTPPTFWSRSEFPTQTYGSQNQVVIPNQGEQFVFFRLAPAPPAEVDIDVDTNRSGEIEDDADEEDEDKPVKFLEDKGALVLVNCNADRPDAKPGDGLRDMDDRRIFGAEDQADMSPISLELKRDLVPGEILRITMATIDTNGAPDKKLPLPIRFKDKVIGRTLFGAGNSSRLDDFPLPGGSNLFPGGKKIRYDGRFLLEGLKFATEVEIRLQIYNLKAKKAVAEDVVRVATTPWLANHHLQPLADANALKIPGNFVNSESYLFGQAYGSTLLKAGDELEFVQDGVEWGYQVRRQKPAANSRVMIVALRLYTEREDEHPLKFAGPKVGVYGWSTNDEQYFENKGNRKAGDQGGNLECLPPTDKFPFGRIIYGDYMSQKLQGFLTRQGVQFGLQLQLSQVGLPHVDEMIVVVPKKDGWVVILPDWDAGRAILAANQGIENVALRILVPGQVVDQTLTKYGQILDYIDKQAAGQKWAGDFRNAIAAIDKQLKAEGVQTLRLPGMYFVTPVGGANMRGWPRNIANCQVVNPKAGDPGTLVISMPPALETKQEDPFLTQWKAIFKQQGITIGLEDMTFAWQKGGEAHCSSNGIREPMKK